jgi:mannose-1-phosphate guanylyltransferase
MKIVPVILSGGSGTRLWPLSRKQYPKQYLPLVGDNTMLQETILRLSGLDNLAEPIIICNENHRLVVAEQCQQINTLKSSRSGELEITDINKLYMNDGKLSIKATSRGNL